MKIAFVVATLVCVGVAVYYFFPLVQVVGNSMFPTYHDNEIIVGTRLYRKSELKIGDVIVYESPMEEGRLVIKRISEILIDGKQRYFYFLGDNADHSYDSRYYGYVPSKNLVCKVINQREDANYANSSNQKGQNS